MGMLQKYDTLKSSILLAIAAAGGLTIAPFATAEVACNGADGYGPTVATYVTEASACIAASDAIRTDFADELVERMNRDRAATGFKVLERRTSLDKAAQAHALDMATRNYADHLDKEGRDHLFRVRAFDRSMLAGNTGANVLISESGADAADIYVAMLEDELNAENLAREGFTHVGLGVVRHGGTSYVVQIFTTMEGELTQDLPLTLAGTTPIRANLAGKSNEAVAWGITDAASGEVIAKGNTSRVRASRLGTSPAAALDIVVSASTDLLVLKGPLVSAR
jgi:uncharacterized protein YkwD